MDLFRTITLLSLTFIFLVPTKASELVNDPLYPDQWYLNGSEGPNGGSFGIGFNHYLESRITATDENITFIIGQGIKFDHEDIKSSMWVNPDEIINNNIDDDLNGYIDDIHGVNITKKNGDISDYYGLGTEMASLISAEYDNYTGIAGISNVAKVASCIFADENGGTIENFDKCVDYIIYLKEVKQQKISSVVLTFGINLFEQYDAIAKVKPVFEKLNDAEILVISPMRGEIDQYFFAANLDLGLDFPGAYLLPNVITISGRGTNGNYYGYGANSISTTAPANYLLTASINKKHEKSEQFDFLFDQNDIPTSQLNNVSISTEKYYTGNSSWEVYSGDIDSFIELPPINLEQYQGKEILFSFYTLNLSERWINLDYYDESISSWLPMGSFFMPSKQWQSISSIVSVHEDIGEKLKTLKLRLGYPAGIVNDTYHATTAYIDEITISDPNLSTESDGYRYASGTALAAAQVAGAISLLNSINDLAPWEVRNLIISSGELVNEDLSIPSHQRTISNKILQIYGSNENGLLNCKDQYIHKRIYPTTERWIARAIGDELIIKGIHINCNKSNGPLTIIDEFNNKSYKSVDNGVYPDLISDDGYNITKLSFDEVGVHNLKIDTDNDLKVLALQKYHPPKKVPLITKDDRYSTRIDKTPFHINIGGVKTSTCLLNNMEVGNLMLSSQYYEDEFIFDSPKCAPEFDSQLINDINNRPSQVVQKPKSHKNIKTTAFTESSDDIKNSTTEVESKTYFNNISDISEDNIYIYTHQKNTTYSEELLLFSSEYRILGEEGERTYIVKIKNNETTLEEFTADIQAIFFEKNSTIVLSYSNVSKNLYSLIENRGIRIGKDYNQFISGDFENEVSYIFKVNDGVNSPPEQVQFDVDIADEKIELNNLFNDIDNDTLFFIDNTNNDNFKIDRLGTMSLTNNALSESSYIINVEVSDGEESINAYITINNKSKTNIPPKLKTNTFEIYTSEQFNINLYDYIENVEDEVVVINPINLPPKITISSGVLSGTLFKDDKPLDNIVTISITDEVNIVTELLYFNLIYKNHLPQVKSDISNITLVENTSLTLYLSSYFDDIDNDELQFTTSSSAASIITSSSGEVVMNIKSNIIGNHNIDISIDDSNGGVIQYSISLTIIENSTTPTEPVEVDSDKKSGGGSLSHYLLMLLLIISIARNKKTFSFIIK